MNGYRRKFRDVNFAPYLPGELRNPRNVARVLAAVLVILFLVMEIANFSAFFTGVQKQFQVGVVWVMLACYVIYAEYAIGSKVKFHPFQLAGFLLFLIGIPGFLFSQSGPGQVYFFIAYVAIMAVRLLLVFVILPRMFMKSEVPPVHLILNWMLITSFLSCLVVTVDYTMLGFNIFNSSRPSFWTGAKWIHPNTAGFYATFAFYTAALAEKSNPILRIASLGIGFYLALVTQSRSALVIIIAALLLYAILAMLENPRKYSFRIASWGTVGGVLLFTMFVVFKELPLIAGLINRFTKEDFTSGRDEGIQLALLAWRESPIFGFGFLGMQLDSAYITFLGETGLVGLLVYFALFLTILYRAFMHFANGNYTEKILGKAVLIMGVSTFIRGFVENVQFMMITDLQSNAFCILATIAFLMPVRQRQIVISQPGGLTN